MGISSSCLEPSVSDGAYTDSLDDDSSMAESLMLEDVHVVFHEGGPWTKATVVLVAGILRIFDGKNEETVISLIDHPTIDVEGNNENSELVIHHDGKTLKIRTHNDEEAKKWLSVVRYQIMTNLQNEDIFTSRMVELIEQVDAIENIMNNDDLEDVPQDFQRQSLHKPIIVPVLNIVILVVGTRGDAQPFIYLGQQLQKDGHRVRLATHAEYRQDVIKGGLEFYPLAGDPKALSEYMVKTGGRLMPDLLNKEERTAIPVKMKMLKEICFSCYPACVDADPGDTLNRPFTADAIISNPVSYGHIHCAQALGVPLHIMFPQPWSPTRAFPHPLSNIGFDSTWSSKNYYSYLMVDEVMWLGLGSIMNAFRRQVLHLAPIRFGERGESILNLWKVPISHMWSPTFLPRCRDWPSHVDVVGEFRKMDETPGNSSYTPDQRLVDFLNAGEKPIYMGFGSMVIEEANKVKLIDMVKAAAKTLKCRMILQSGWTKYAEDYEYLVPDLVLVVGSMPHDYLFTQVSSVIHHGGAGTTSAGLRAGNTTFICPFFGDQYFWATMVERAGAGPKGCPVRELTTEILIKSLQVLRDPVTVAKAKELGDKMMQENGPQMGVDSFYRNLPIERMICDVSIFDNQISTLARVYCKECGLKMCLEVDRVIHRQAGPRANHHVVTYQTKIWGKSNANAIKLINKNSDKSSILFRSTHRQDTIAPTLIANSNDLTTLGPEEFNIEKAYSKAIAFKSFWDKLDSDGDAVINEDELTAFFASKEDAKAIMAAVDWNGNQSLSFAELAWIISQRPNIKLQI